MLAIAFKHKNYFVKTKESNKLKGYKKKVQQLQLEALSVPPEIASLNYHFFSQISIISTMKIIEISTLYRNYVSGL